MTRMVIVCMAAVAVLAVTGCARNWCPPPDEPTLSVGCVESRDALKLDRGDWQVSRRTAVWKVLESRPDTPPVAIGVLTQRKYRQLRGGPEYSIYEVSRMNRQDIIGRIDQMGRAWRLEPARNEGFEEVDLGVSRLEDAIAMIFDTKRAVMLEPTTERRLAFDLLDVDGSGLLEPAEIQNLGDRIASGDRNRDGLVDFEEFDAIDVL